MLLSRFALPEVELGGVRTRSLLPALVAQRWAWPLAALLAAAALATAAVGSGFIVANDYTEMQVDPAGFLRRLNLAWVPNIYLGYHSGFMHAYATPYGWASALLQTVGIPPAARQRALDFAVFFAIAAGAYWGVGRVAPATTRSARVCGALVYLLNPYVALNVGTGTSNMLAPYAALPFLIGFTALALRGRIAPINGGICVGIVTFFGGGINVPLVAMNALVVALYAAIAVAGAPSPIQTLRRLLPFACAGLAAALVLDLYWIAPLLDYLHTFWLGGLLDESPKEHSADSSFANVMRGLGQWSIFRGDDAGPWYLWAGAYRLPFFAWILWFPALFGALGLALRKRIDVPVAFFATLAALAVPLAVGYYRGAAGLALSAPVYDFFFTKVPGFAMFRSAYKWVWPYEFALAGLFVLGVSALQARAIVARRRHGWSIPRNVVPLAALPASLVLIAFAPIASNKMYHPNLPLPAWTLNEARFVGRDTAHRLALFPGQYLEWYDWLDRSFQLEAQMIDKPIVGGYMTGAPAEESHVLLTRAYKLARSGDPRAADIFRAISVDAVLQRDDYRSLMDFAFVGSWVPTDTSLAHDLLTRIVGARPEARDAANRLYALGGSLPTVFGTANARLDPRPALVVAASGDYARIARGETIVTPDGLSPADFAALSQSLVPSAGTAASADAVTSLLANGGPHAECFAATCSLTVARSARYHIFIASLSVYPSDFREAFDLPGYDFTRADGVALPGSVRVDGTRLPLRSAAARTWHDFGTYALAEGAHGFEIAGASPTTPALVALVPEARWRAAYVRVGGAVLGSAVDFESTVQGRTTEIEVPSSGRYLLSASPRVELDTAPVREPSIAAARLRPDAAFGAARWARAGASIELPFVPGSGMLALNPGLMPAAWYLDSSLYTWNRGSVTDWYLLEPESRLRVTVPFARSVRATLTLRIAGVNHALRPFEIFVDGRRAGRFVVGGGSGPLAADPGRVPLGTERPAVRTVQLELHPGMHDIRLSSPPVATWSARDVDPSTSYADQVVAAVGADIAFTARVPAGGALRSTQPATRATGVDTVAVALPASRAAGDAPFAVMRLPLDGERLDGVPSFAINAETFPGWGIEWLAIAVSDDEQHSHVRFRIVQNVGVGGHFSLTPSRMLPNSASDAARRIVGAWVVLGVPAAQAAAPGRIAYALHDLHVERMLPERSIDSAVGSLPVRVDGRRAGETLQLARGRHVVSAAGAGDIGVLRVQTAGLPAARAIPLRIERTSAVALNVRTSGQTPPFVLVLNESFHPEWQATLDGRVLPHVRANGFANGWVVPAGRTAQLVEVRFTAQRTYLTTVWVSLAGGLLCLGLLAWPRR